MAIPEPFRPTPLQYASMSHPIIIDFISWPCIRDQMILQCQTLDLDALCRDLTLHTVVDVPERQQAVGVYDYLRGAMTAVPDEQHMFPTVSASAPLQMTCLDGPDEWPYLQIPLGSPLTVSSDPAEDVILQEIERRLQDPTATATFGPPASLRDGYVGGVFRAEVVPAGQPSGVDVKVRQPCKWKLSREFAWQWPLLDCSSGKLIEHSGSHPESCYGYYLCMLWCTNPSL